MRGICFAAATCVALPVTAVRVVLARVTCAGAEIVGRGRDWRTAARGAARVAFADVCGGAALVASPSQQLLATPGGAGSCGAAAPAASALGAVLSSGAETETATLGVDTEMSTVPN